MLARYLPLFALSLTACPPDPGQDADKDVVGDDSGTPTGGTTPENHAPSTPVVAITPEVPTDADPLTAILVQTAEDPDGDSVTYRFAWSRNGVLEPTLTTELVSAEATSDGDVWVLSVTPTDGMADGTPATDTVAIGNLPPVPPTLHLEPATPGAGDAIRLVVDTPAVDPEGAALTETIQWYVDDAYAQSWDGRTEIEGMYVDSGETYRCVVTESDGVNAPVPVEASVTVSNEPPQVNSVQIAPASPEDADDLTVRVNAEDPDGDDLTYHYRWFRDGVEATDVGDTETVDQGDTEVAQVWYVEVEATDGAAFAYGTSDTVTIAGPPMLRYGLYFSGIATPDGSGGWADVTGTWEVLLQTEGAQYGHVDCNAFWEVTGTAARCRGCEFAFDTVLTYDSAASTMNTPGACSYLEQDGVGVMESSGGDYFRFEATGPQISVYYYGTPYPYDIYWYVYGNYSYSYGGYRYGMGIRTDEDTAGMLRIDAYSYRYYAPY